MPEQSFTTPAPVRLEVKVAAGDIGITTVDGQESAVVLDGPEKLLDTIEVELMGDRLVIEQRRKPRGGWSLRSYPRLEVRVRVPHESSVEVATAAGDATLDGIFGGLAAKSASGGVAVRGELRGDAHARTVSGNVCLSRVVGDLSAHTVSGDVSADSVDGSVSVKSVSGDVRLGSVHEGKVNVQSVSGNIELGVASGTSIDIDAVSASGVLSSEIPLSGEPAGDAGPTVVIRGSTVSGNVRVLRAA